MRLFDRIVGVPEIRGNRMLIDPRLADRSNHVLYIEARFDKVFRQSAEQFGIRWRVAGADVVDRFNQPASQQLAPDAIHITAGEVTILG